MTKECLCPCGGKAIYFGEALMGSLTCNLCGDWLSGIGIKFIKSIEDRWNRGERGYFDEEL